MAQAWFLFFGGGGGSSRFIGLLTLFNVFRLCVFIHSFASLLFVFIYAFASFFGPGWDGDVGDRALKA